MGKIIDRVVERNFASQFTAAMDYALATAKIKVR
jgi:hypothetical protein